VQVRVGTVGQGRASIIAINGQGTILKKCGCKNKARCEHGWTLRYWVDGKQREKTFRDTIGADNKVRYGSGKQLAQDFQAKLYAGKRAGDVSFADTKPGDVPFIKYCEAWIARRPRTQTTYLAALKHLRPALAGKTLRQVAEDREGAQKMIDTAPGTYGAKARIVLVSPVNEAVKAGRLTSHRLRGLEVKVSSQRVTIIPATNEQLEITAAKLGDAGLLVWLGVMAGLRLGESLGVNVADFTDGGTNLRLTRQRMADGTLAPLKAREEGDYRDIPVSASLWKRVQDVPVDAEGYFFPSRVRNNDAFCKARDAAALPAKFTPHHLRHLYASYMLSDYVPISDVAHFLGHENINTTFTYYGHCVPAAKDRAREVIDRRWSA
jgi:integrase